MQGKVFLVIDELSDFFHVYPLKGLDVVMTRLVDGACGIEKPGDRIHMSIVMESGR